MTDLEGWAQLTPGAPSAIRATIDGDRIAAISEVAETDLGPDAPWILPGLIDIHCHGGGGASFTSADPVQVRTAAAFHRAQGTTTIVASAVTDTPDRMLAVVEVLADAVDAQQIDAIHLEGPFLAHARCGAQDPRLLLAPDARLTSRLLAAGRGHVRTMTLAPELDGQAEVLAVLDAAGVIAAVGHTEASASAVQQHVRSRVGLITHLFNGMAPMHHRDAGPALGSLAAASAGDATVELIADGVHVSDETAAAVLRIAGASRVALITDAMAAAGMPDGDYRLGPQQVRVADGVARLLDGGSIAGGTAHLLAVVRRLVHAGVERDVALSAASRTPALTLGLSDRGQLAPGARADVVLADASWTPIRVLRAGEWHG